MFERFSTAATAVVVTAEAVARARGCTQVDDDHLVVAALTQPDDPGLDELLGSCGLDRAAVRAAATRLRPVGPGAPEDGHVPFGPSARAVLQHALVLALAAGRVTIHPAQLLLAAATPSGAGGRLLAELGIGDPAMQRWAAQAPLDGDASSASHPLDQVLRALLAEMELVRHELGELRREVAALRRNARDADG